MGWSCGTQRLRRGFEPRVRGRPKLQVTSGARNDCRRCRSMWYSLPRDHRCSSIRRLDVAVIEGGQALAPLFLGRPTTTGGSRHRDRLHSRCSDQVHEQRSLRLTNYGWVAMPFGAVVEGEIVDPEAVSGALARTLAPLRIPCLRRRDRGLEPEGRRSSHRLAVHGDAMSLPRRSSIRLRTTFRTRSTRRSWTSRSSATT